MYIREKYQEEIKYCKTMKLILFSSTSSSKRNLFSSNLILTLIKRSYLMLY